MLQWAKSIPSRTKAFVLRNKGKLIGSAVLIGGVWYYYRDTITQAWQMYQLIQQVQNSDIHEQKGDERVEEETLVSAFGQTVLTGDETSQKYFQQIRLNRAELYAQQMEQIQGKLKSGSGEKEEREKLFSELNFLVFSRLILSVVSVNLLLLLARVEVCLIGRANRGPQVSEDTKIDHRELLSALRFLPQKDSMAEIDSVVRGCVGEVFGNRNVTPATVTTRDQLLELMFEVTEVVVTKLKTIDAKAAKLSAFAWLLGKRLAESEDQSTICQETLDILESPQFISVLTFAVKQTVAEAISRSIPESVGSTFPLAVLIASIRAEAESVTTVNGPHVILFQSLPIVDEFCRAIYSASNDAADPDDLAMLQQLSDDDDPHMAKLGELLERLVKADTTSS